jgi:16S rRNA (guanine527-N7)-methyltransferase
MEKMNKEQFLEELKKIGITPTLHQLNQLEEYYKLLIEWNSKINLTRITEEEDVYLKHFYDSLTISKVVGLNNYSTLLDFGTGAGFPGMVLKIIYPNLKITLVDSLQKRINFLNEVIKKLDLKNIETIHERIENIKDRHFDIITTRAVANLSKLLNYTNKIIDSTTLFIPLKANIDEEIVEAQRELKKYKLKISKREEFYLPKENSIRNILVIQRI